MASISFAQSIRTYVDVPAGSYAGETVRGVLERLRGAGFRVTPRPDLQGVVARRGESGGAELRGLP